MPPAQPKDAHEADKADPGEIEKVKAQQQQNQSGKYRSQQIKPYKPPQTKEQIEKKKSWIEIKLVDEEGQPVPGEEYRVTLPDGQTVAEGTLDEKGFARVEGIEPGKSKIAFPRLDKSAWKRQ